MTKITHYAVNCSDAWRLCPDDPTEGTFVKYETYEELEQGVKALLADIRSRYPGQEFTCPYIKKLAELVGEIPKVPPMEETLPVAERMEDEKFWMWEDVTSFYPEIVEYWESKGAVVRITPCGPVNEDCLYLNGKWFSYCRWPFEWKLAVDLPEGWEYPEVKPRYKRSK